MRNVVGSGPFTYEVDEEWARLPQGWEMTAAAVAGDSHDRVYVFDRGDHPVMVFDRDGAFLYSWGEGLIRMAHAIHVDAHDNVWLVDSHGGQVMKFTTEGKPLMTIGVRGYRSDTGVDPNDFRSDTHLRVTHPGGPFNIPAGVAVAPSGDVFVADGYANCRVHRFSPQGELITSWGTPGAAPGQFNLPHGVSIDRHGRVLVSDRENDRVQLFTQDGEFLSVWPAPLVGPALVHLDRSDVAYVPEHNGGFFSVLTLEGERLARWGSEANRACHGVWVDSRGDVYFIQPGAFGPKRRVVKYRLSPPRP